MQVVYLNTVTQVCLVIIAVAQIGLLLAIGLGLLMVMKKLKTLASDTVDEALDKALPRIQPVLDNVSHVTGQVSDIVDRIAPKVEHIAADSEDTVHNVTTKVKTTSTIVTENVAKPIVNIASLLTGVQRGLEVWKTAKTENGSDGVAMASGDGRAVPPEVAAHS